MVDHAYTVLECDDLLEIVASYARSQLGKDRVRSIRPRHTPSEAMEDQRTAADALAVLQGEGILPGVEFADVSPVLHRLEPEGAVVNGGDLLLFRQLLDAVQAVVAACDQEQFEEAAALRAEIESLHRFADLRGELHRMLEDDGGLKDRASEELYRLRRQIRAVETDIQDRLAKLVRRSDMREVMQEDFVTIRNNRFVVPVRREMKGRCRGIIHDHSDSGQTVFVEPSHTVSLGNELADLRLDERDECIRILARLSARIRARRPDFRENLQRLAALDAALAVARWGFEYECAFPTFEAGLDLRRARHPLLAYQFSFQDKADAAVPLDLKLDPHTGVLAITGSNSGGKTVAMKTVGLLSLLAASGMPVSADPDSRFEFFRPVFADIGDEQSLAENLSTFTGHVSNIRTVLETLADTAKDGKREPRALVLLDELGAGTDPLEGGALGCAVLEELVEQPALTIVTTHLGVIKNVVHESDRMVNAAVRFNIDTLEPEYVLEVGQPGASNAFRIARRLGMPERLLDRAEALLGSDHLHLEQLLSQLEEDQQRISRQEDESRHALNDAARNRDALQKELDSLRRERRKLMQDAYRQAEITVSNTRKEMERLVKRIREAGAAEAVTEAARDARQRIEQKERKLDAGLEQTGDRVAASLDPAALAVGQRVFVKKLNGDATIAEVRNDRKRVTVKTGALTVTVKPEELAPPLQPEPEKQTPSFRISRPRPAQRVSSELNVIGCTVDEARPRVEAFLDQAALAGLDGVRIVHGVGTGRLQKGVHALLREHPLVRNFRLGQDEKDPGGAGATGVQLGEGSE